MLIANILIPIVLAIILIVIALTLQVAFKELCDNFRKVIAARNLKKQELERKRNQAAHAALVKRVFSSPPQSGSGVSGVSGSGYSGAIGVSGCQGISGFSGCTDMPAPEKDSALRDAVKAVLKQVDDLKNKKVEE